MASSSLVKALAHYDVVHCYPPCPPHTCRLRCQKTLSFHDPAQCQDFDICWELWQHQSFFLEDQPSSSAIVELIEPLILCHFLTFYKPQYLQDPCRVGQTGFAVEGFASRTQSLDHLRPFAAASFCRVESMVLFSDPCRPRSYLTFELKAPQLCNFGLRHPLHLFRRGRRPNVRSGALMCPAEVKRERRCKTDSLLSCILLLKDVHM